MLCYVRYVRSLFLTPNAPLELLPVVLRVPRVIHVPAVMLPDVPPGVIIVVLCVFFADGSGFWGSSEHNPVASATPVWVPPSPAPGPAPPPPPSLPPPAPPVRTPPSTPTPTPTPRPDVGAGAGAVGQGGAGVGVGVTGQGRVRGAGRSGRVGLVGAVRATTNKQFSIKKCKPNRCKLNQCKPNRWKPNEVGPLCAPCSACPPTVISFMLP